jgi:hypothetical protein
MLKALSKAIVTAPVHQLLGAQSHNVLSETRPCSALQIFGNHMEVALNVSIRGTTPN